MELRFKTRDKIVTAYTAPISCRGLLSHWRGDHNDYHRGLVVRVLWFGFVLRWGKKRRHNNSFDKA